MVDQLSLVAYVYGKRRKDCRYSRTICLIFGFSSSKNISFLFEMSLGKVKCFREAVNSFKMLKEKKSKPIISELIITAEI